MARRRLDSLSQMALQNVQAQRKAAGSYAQEILAARARFITLRLQKDQAIRRIYETAADNVASEIRSLVPGGSPLRRRHMTALEKVLRTLANDINQGVTRELQDGIVQSVAAGVQPHAAITARLLASAAGAGGPPLDLVRVQWLFAGVNQRAVEAIWARVDPNGLRLSNRIWKAARRNQDVLRDLVVDAVARGRDSVALARDLEQYLKRRTPAAAFPNMMRRMGRRIPKDLSYEALRLARTEMTAAFGEGTIAAGAVAPSYLGIKWVLSGAHPEPDVCDERARGGPNGNGVYPKGQEPAYPAHPNDLCSLIPQHEEPKDFVERLRKWRDNPASDPALEDWYNNIYSQGLVPGGLTGSPAITALTATPPPAPSSRQVWERAVESLIGGDDGAAVDLANIVRSEFDASLAIVPRFLSRVRMDRSGMAKQGLKEVFEGLACLPLQATRDNTYLSHLTLGDDIGYGVLGSYNQISHTVRIAEQTFFGGLDSLVPGRTNVFETVLHEVGHAAHRSMVWEDYRRFFDELWNLPASRTGHSGMWNRWLYRQVTGTVKDPDGSTAYGRVDPLEDFAETWRIVFTDQVPEREAWMNTASPGGTLERRKRFRLMEEILRKLGWEVPPS